jgi:LacI family transcriptional regulator
VDVAAAAGVSKTTVSRVLNGSPRVAPETRERVTKAIAARGFQVNQAARSLRTARTGLVGFLVPIISVFGLIVEALDAELAREGLAILLTSTRRRAPERDLDAIETLVSRGVDALVIAPSNDRDPELARYLRGVRCPIVLLDREVKDLRCDTVLIDQTPGIHGALEHFASLGRRRVGLLTRDRKTRPGREMIAAYRSGCARYGLKRAPALLAEFDDLDQQAGREGVDALLESGADALLATGTMTLTGSVLERLGEHSLRVPADVPLVVYGHRGTGGSEPAGLPTVAYPVDEIAAATSRVLRARLVSARGRIRTDSVRTAFVNPRG